MVAEVPPEAMAGGGGFAAALAMGWAWLRSFARRLDRLERNGAETQKAVARIEGHLLGPGSG